MQTPAWKPLADAYVPVRKWLGGIRPDVAIVVYNDHGADFMFDKYPTFAIGAAERYGIADEGFGTRALPEVRGNQDFSFHLVESLVANEFDLTVCQEMAVEHGFLVLGQALRKAVESYPGDLKVLVMGTGGMSHQLQGKRFGYMSEDSDNEFLDRLEGDPESLAQMSHHELMQKAGAEAVELIMWHVMRGALSPNARRVHRHYYAPMTTGMGLITFED